MDDSESMSLTSEDFDVTGDAFSIAVAMYAGHVCDAGRALQDRSRSVPEHASRLLAERVIDRLVSTIAKDPGCHDMRDDIDTSAGDGLEQARPGADVGAEVLTGDLPGTRRAPERAPERADRGGANHAMIDRFCDALISSDPEAWAAGLARLQAGGASVDILLSQTIAEAARRLGERWLEDEVSFLQVTLGAARLHEAVRSLSPQFDPADGAGDPRLSALLAPVPGEDHSLGILMASNLMRRDGWQVELMMSPTKESIVDAATAGHHGLIGLSAGSRAMIPSLTETVGALRAAKPKRPIVIGGMIVTLEPGIARAIGAHAGASDATDALHQMKRLAIEWDQRKVNRLDA